MLLVSQQTRSFFVVIRCVLLCRSHTECYIIASFRRWTGVVVYWTYCNTPVPTRYIAKWKCLSFPSTLFWRLMWMLFVHEHTMHSEQCVWWMYSKRDRVYFCIRIGCSSGALWLREMRRPFFGNVRSSVMEFALVSMYFVFKEMQEQWGMFVEI